MRTGYTTRRHIAAVLTLFVALALTRGTSAADDETTSPGLTSLDGASGGDVRGREESAPGDGADSGANGETVFFDDFDDPALDRTKWNVRTTGRVFNDEQQAYIDSADTLQLVRGAKAAGAKNGALVIRALHREGFKTPDGRHFDFVSARINTRDKVEVTYGTVSARIKLPDGPGVWPAFWTLGKGRWPATGEIDIMEYVGETGWTSTALHGPGYSGATPFVKKTSFGDRKDATDWHVYSVDRTADAIIFRIDGEVVYRVTRDMVEERGRWVFDAPQFLILNVALGGDYPFSANRVRSPYKGIPQATVERIKKGAAKMLVDWVRVTRTDGGK